MGAKFITLDADEFNKVCKRVHELLTSRVDKAWNKHQKKPTQKTSDTHIEASKDAFAFIHLLELVEHMTAEIHDLRMMMSAMNNFDDASDFQSVATAGKSKKNYIN